MKLFLQINLLFFLLFSRQAAVAAGEKILYIPLDNRPVCLSYVVETADAAGYSLLTPSEEFLASNSRSGSPEKLWLWLLAKAPEAKIAVISADSLLYGGLVSSRTHTYDQDTLNNAAERFQTLRKNNPHLKLYVFSTIMRTPQQSYGNVEPPYYSKYGPDIFKLSALLDKDEAYSLTAKEKIELGQLNAALPHQVTADWFGRREKNFKLNRNLIAFARARTFNFLAIGKDDDAPLSQTHREARHLVEASLDLPETRLQLLSGVDQLGLLLITRAINDSRRQTPLINVIYSEGEGKNTLPYYSDQRLSTSVPEQILALGGKPVAVPGDADLVLAVNSPYDGITKDATYMDNLFFSSPYNKRFRQRIESLLTIKKPVAVADIAYANGADNGFMDELYKHRLLEKLTAYSGWNTADNTIGYALAQGVLGLSMDKQQQKQLLYTRYLDDWLYQANVRPELRTMLDRRDPFIVYNITNLHQRILKATNAAYSKQFQRYSFLQNTKFTYEYPWERLFEIEIKVQ